MHVKAKGILFLFMSENDKLKYISKHFLMVSHFFEKKAKRNTVGSFSENVIGVLCSF